MPVRAWLSGIVAVVSLALGIMVLRPAIRVSNDQPLNQSDPFSTPFIVTNDGTRSVYSVSTSCVFHESRYERTGRIDGKFTTLTAAAPTLPELTADGKTSTSCWAAIDTTDARFGDRLTYADISIFVDFRPRFWPFRNTREARFVTQGDAAGNLRWLPLAPGESGHRPFP